MADRPQSDSPYEFAPQTPAQEPSAPPLPGEPPLSPPASIATEERLCPHCGFRIVGKVAKNRCPDCAGDLSASDELFQFSSPAWARSVASGLFLLVPALFLHCGAMTLTWASESKTLGAALHFAGALIATVGAWIATQGEFRTNTTQLGTRWPTRFLALGSLAIATAAVLLATRRGHSEAMLLKLVVVQLIWLAIFGLSIGLHLRALAMRMPNDSLVWWSQNMAFLVPIVVLAQIAFHVTERAKAEFLMLFMCSIPMAGGFTVIALLAAWTLFRAGIEMRVCATTAEAIVIRRIKKQEQREAQKRGN